MIYLDSNVFIFAALTDDERAEKAKELLTKIISGKTQAYTSAITIDEVTWVIWKETKDKEFAIKESIRILQFNNLHIIPVDEKILYEALDILKNLKNIKPRDAIHIASCFHKKIPIIASDDSDFDNIQGLKRLPLS